MRPSCWIRETIGSIKAAPSRGGAFSFILTVYVGGGLLLLDIYRYHINTDVPTYVAIAQKYASGHFHDAVNSFWSPLISWLMVPFILSGVDPLVAFKIIGLIAGLFAFFALRGLLLDFSVPERDAYLLLPGLIPAFYAFTLITMNPDFLLAVILLFYVRRVISEDYGKNRLDGAVCGLLGAAAYFAKGFAFPFFIAHFTLMNLCRYVAVLDAASRKRIRASLVIGLATFALFSSPWVGLISAKYGHWTFNNAGSYNYGLVMHQGENPFDNIGFHAPADSDAVSFWDGLDGLSAKSSFGRGTPVNVTRTMAVMGRNFVQAVDIYQAGSLFSVAILLGSVFCLAGSPRRELLGNQVFLALATIALYTAGYLPLLVIKRYFYLNILLIFVLGGALLCRHDFAGRGCRKAALLCLALSFMFMPVRDLHAMASVGRDIYSFSKVLGQMGVGGRIASNGRWDDSLFAAYHLRARYYGIAKSGIDDSELLRELHGYRIDHYLCWQDKPCHRRLSRYPEISGGKFAHLRVYKLADADRDYMTGPSGDDH